jgi:endoplasmic reticulum-Golgi intermediate compartment protein 2
MDLSELDESTSSPANPLKAFDAFPKIHQSYRHSRSSRGGIVSVALLCVVTILFWTELVTWWRGAEIMKVSVEEGVGHGMQLNVDITIAMACEGLRLIDFVG